MVNTVACSRCSAVVPQSETEFSSTGNLLCRRCANLNQAHAQVERAREAAYEQTRVASNAFDYAIKVAQRHEADADAQRDHSILATIEAAGPIATPMDVECSRCKNTVHREQATYALDGQTMCKACAATYDPRAERRKKEGTFMVGFLFGFFFSIFGASYVHFFRKKSAEIDGAMIGLIAGTIIIYLPLSCVVLEKAK